LRWWDQIQIDGNKCRGCQKRLTLESKGAYCEKCDRGIKVKAPIIFFWLWPLLFVLLWVVITLGICFVYLSL